MRSNIKNFKMHTVSVNDNLKIVNQNTISVQEHIVKSSYTILADNRKNWRNQTVYAPGYFNKITDFTVGNDNSLFIIDQNLNILKTPNNNIDNIKGRNDLFLIYPIPCFNMTQNYELNITDNNTDETITIELSQEFGELVGRILAQSLPLDSVPLKDTTRAFLENFIIYYDNQNIREKCIKLDNSIIINTNVDFVLGILNGYYINIDSKSFILNNNLNPHSFSTMLNYLGASYSIRKMSNNQKNIWIQLPRIFKNKMEYKFIRLDQFIIEDDKIIKSKKVNNDYIDSEEDTLISRVNKSEILLIPVDSFDFIPSKTNLLYDFTCERSDSTNYNVGFSPIMKNSDGDILGVQALFTKEALIDADKFSPAHKDHYRSLNDGSIMNFIADDAILGLYEITKDLK